MFRGIGPGGGGGSPWTPAQLSPKLWLRASDIQPGNLVGPDVDVWPDSSGSGNEFSAASSVARPLFVASGFNGGAGISSAYVEFDGVAEYLRKTAFNYGSTPTAETILFVMQTTNALSQNRTLYSYTARPTANLGGLGDAIFYSWASDGAQLSSSGNSFAPNAFVSAAVVWDGSVKNLYKSGTLNGGPVAAVGAHQTTGNNFFLATAQSLSNFMSVRYAEFVVVPSAITAPQLASWAAYSVARYGV